MCSLYLIILIFRAVLVSQHSSLRKLNKGQNVTRLTGILEKKAFLSSRRSHWSFLLLLCLLNLSKCKSPEAFLNHRFQDYTPDPLTWIFMGGSWKSTCVKISPEDSWKDAVLENIGLQWPLLLLMWLHWSCSIRNTHALVADEHFRDFLLNYWIWF